MRIFIVFIFLIFLLGCEETNKHTDSDNFEIIVGQDGQIDVFFEGGAFKKKKALKLNNSGTELIKQNQINSAQEKFKDAYKIEPDNPIVLTNLGNIYQVIGKEELALEYYNDAFKISDSTYFIAAYNMGRFYYNLNDYGKSEAILNYLISHSTNKIQTLIAKYQLIRTYVNQGKCRAAKELYTSIHTDLDKFPELKENREKLEERLEICPRQNNKLDVFWDSGFFKNSKAKQLNSLGIELINENQIDRAEEKFIEAYRIEPDNPSISVNLGNIYQEKGTKKMALEYYNESLSFADSTYFPALYNIAVVHNYIGKYEKSREMLEHLVAKTRNKSHKVLAELEIVRVLINMNKCTKAKIMFEEIGVDLNTYPEHKEHLINLEEQLISCKKEN